MAVNKMIKFTVFGEPISLKRHRDAGMAKTKDGRMFSRKYDPSKGDKQDFLAMAMENRPENPIDFAVSVTIRCFFKRPASHFGRKNKMPYLKDNAPLYHISRPDGDNLAKFVFDALNKVFWIDDSVVSIHKVIKEYTTNVAPRMEIEIVKL